MTALPNSNRRIALANRPAGAPQPDNFRLEEVPFPDPEPGEVLVRGLFLSVDPYMRGRIRDVKSYAPPVAVGGTMPGGAVGEVVRSRDPAFAPGDLVVGDLGWQEFAAAPAKALRKVPPEVQPVSLALGVLGMPGLTAYFGLLEVGAAKAGETVVVSSASGAVGAVVGQTAKIKGCRAVGIAGSDEKVAYCLDELGFDAAINYNTGPDIGGALKKACPDGIDVYFDNVGGPITDAALLGLNERARVAVCGQISGYNSETAEMGPRLLWQLIVKRARIEGFLIFDYAKRYDEALRDLGEWVQDGRIKFREDIAEGLEHAPEAFIGMLAGRNFGKQLVRLAR
ncbi:MAG TPA: NADP-dependent oxidoreductase [Alphaproteobacteria bacterium]|nr:NADP-dependent oxidoreductase [Alphaproteobacteria bacterium]